MRGIATATPTLLISLLVLGAGCGGGSNSTGTAGSGGGTTGTAGTTGAGGSAGTTGTAGTTGSAGTTGTAGTTGSAGTTGGAGGSGGSGTAGTSGGSGGSGTAGTGGSGTAGSGGSGGSGVGGGTAGAGGRGGSGGGTAGSGGGAGGRGGTGGGTGGGGGGATGFRITSSLFTDGMPIPVDSTCATTMQNSRLPDLAWTGAPAGTMSFALAFVDATMLPASTGFHSVMWDIPGTATSLPYGLPAGSPPTGIAGLESVKQQGPLRDAYLGPCPNMGGSGTTGPVNDTYEFRLYAFGVATLPANLATMTNTMSVINMIAGMNPLGMAVLRGTSNARGSLK